MDKTDYYQRKILHYKIIANKYKLEKYEQKMNNLLSKVIKVDKMDIKKELLKHSVLTEEQYDNYFSKEPSNAILLLDIKHDMKTNIVELCDSFFNMLTGEVVPNYKLPSSVNENYIREQFAKWIKYGSNKNIDSLIGDLRQKYIPNDFSHLTPIFDNGCDGYGSLLQTVFGITRESKHLYVKACEQSLKSKNINFNLFKENGKLKEEYQIQSLMIGYDVIDNVLLNYKNIPSRLPDKILLEKEIDELILINTNSPSPKLSEKIKTEKNKLIQAKEFYAYLISDKILTHFQNFKKTIDSLKRNKKYKSFLINYKDHLNVLSIIDDLEEIDSEDNFLKLYNKVSTNKHILSAIISMKEARDSIYIEELKKIKDPIYITTDRNSAYRCIVHKISVILMLSGIPKFIYIVKDNTFNIIGNPFIVFDELLFDSTKHNNILDFLTKQVIEKPPIEDNVKVFSEEYLKSQKEILALENKCKLIDLFLEDSVKLKSIEELLIKLKSIHIKFFPPFGFNYDVSLPVLEHIIEFYVDKLSIEEIIKYSMIYYPVKLLKVGDIREIAINYNVDKESFFNFIS